MEYIHMAERSGGVSTAAAGDGSGDGQLYVLAEVPPTPHGAVAAVRAAGERAALTELESVLGRSLTQIAEGWTDGTRVFRLYYGDKGIEEFGSLFASFIDGCRPASK